MPTYVYRREDGSTFEVQQRITEPALEQCPETGQKVTRIISGNAGLIFKGSGFYLTDYVRNGNGAKAGKEGKSSETGSNGESTKGSTSDTNSTSGASKAADTSSNA